MQDMAMQSNNEKENLEKTLPNKSSNFPEEWRRVQLGELASVLYGKSRPANKGEIPVIGSGGIYGYTSESLVNDETLIIGRKGAAGCVYYSAEPCYPSDTAFYLVWKQKICVPFLYYSLLFKGLDPDRSVIPSLQRGDVESFRVLLPPLPEQRAIARILQTVQNAIQARRNELELERERKAALMQHLFTHGTRGEATKQTEIGEMPESWKPISLATKCKVRYGLGQPPQKDENGIPMIRATDIKNGHIVIKDVLRVKQDAIPEGRAYFLQKGDIIVVRSGVYAGDVAMYDGQWEKAIAGYDLVVSPTDENISSPFLAYYLQGESNQRYFRSQRDRSAQPHINADQLSNALIPLPFKDGEIDKEEQEEVSEVLVLCDSKITALEKEIALQEELFRALLEELMSGRLSALPLVEAEGGSREA